MMKGNNKHNLVNEHSKQNGIIALEVIDNRLVNDTDIKFLQSIKQELYHDFKTQQIFRTRTEAEISVLNDYKHPTPDAKYWQSVRENMAHFQELVFLSFDYRRNLIKLKQKQKELEIEGNELKRELIKIDIDELQYKIRYQERIAKARIEELKNWHEIKSELKSYMQCGVDNPNDHQMLSLSLRFLNQYKTALKSAVSQSEMQNIEGLLVTAVRRLKERDLYYNFLNLLNNKDRNLIKKII